MHKKPKIAVMMNAFWNAGSGGLSGGDQRLIQIFKRLNSDFDITVFTSKDGRKVVGNQINGARFIIAPTFTNRGIIHLAYFFRSIWGMFVISRQNFNIVYGSSDFLPDVLLCYLYRLLHRKSKWIQCVHHFYPEWRTRSGSKVVNFVAYSSQKFSFCFIKSRADRIVNINTQVQTELSKSGFKPTKLKLNYCGIDLDFFDKIKPVERELRGSFLARLNPSKGIFDLPKIWFEVVKKFPQAKLKMIGGGSEETKDKLEKMIKYLNLEKNIELCGFLPNKPAFQIIADSNVFLFPSHEEGFGMAIAEAMAVGVPCVAWDLNVFSEVFPKVLTTVEEGHIEEFADKVVEIMEDKKLAKDLSDQGYDFVKKYGWDEIAETESNIILKGWQ